MSSYQTKETYHYESYQNGQLVGSMDKEYQNGQLVNDRSFGNVPRSIESSFRSRNLDLTRNLMNHSRESFVDDRSIFSDLSFRGSRMMLPEKRNYHVPNYKPIGKEWVLYGAPLCSYCDRAQKLMNQKGIPYQYYNIEKAPFYSKSNYDQMMKDELGNHRTIPAIFHNGRLIGGYSDLVKYLT